MGAHFISQLRAYLLLLMLAWLAVTITANTKSTIGYRPLRPDKPPPPPPPVIYPRPCNKYKGCRGGPPYSPRTIIPSRIPEGHGR
ncbi:hypothetical protein Sjap_025546 [Stephania japonica]|uniref:Uncharacterized protein n=1 Tax=Stephania japonica TaxID=461633 RepID=A0AAP0E1T3_9MAGN